MLAGQRGGDWWVTARLPVLVADAGCWARLRGPQGSVCAGRAGSVALRDTGARAVPMLHGGVTLLLQTFWGPLSSGLPSQALFLLLVTFQTHPHQLLPQALQTVRRPHGEAAMARTGLSRSRAPPGPRVPGRGEVHAPGRLGRLAALQGGRLRARGQSETSTSDSPLATSPHGLAPRGKGTLPARPEPRPPLLGLPWPLLPDSSFTLAPQALQSLNHHEIYVLWPTTAIWGLGDSPGVWPVLSAEGECGGGEEYQALVL